jgi:hypothetical protein
VLAERTLIRITGGFVIAGGVTLAVVRFLGEVPPGRDLECATGAIAFGLVIAAPGVLALLALRDRPALLLPAAWLLIPLSFISFALVTLPLLIPAYLLFRAYLRAAGPSSTPAASTSNWRTAATTAAVLALLVAAGLSLFAHDDAREWTTASAIYSTSDVITYAEAMLSLALTSSAVAAGWRLSRPVLSPVGATP